MAEPSETEPPAQENGIGVDANIYVDSSALAKLYVPEAESDTLDAFLRGRRGVCRELVTHSANQPTIQDLPISTCSGGSSDRA